ncbi:MAG TPA: ShlB/FhaC/HecB family hemolysin secretion/activation protein [Ramlibacter sp.]
MVSDLPTTAARCGRIRVAILAAGHAGAATASAQLPAAPAPATAAPSPEFTINGFQVTGENPLGEARTQQVLAPFVGRGTIDTLQKATAALETALRERGFGLHRVALPPQEVGDVVRLEIVKFTIAKVLIEGNSRYSDANVRHTVPELREGATPNFKRLAVQTAIANENPNKQLQVGLRESEEPDRIDAAITVKESAPWSFGVNASNIGGSEASGRDRLTFTAGHSNVWDLDHQVLAAYTTSLERPADVKQLGLSWRAPWYRQGMVMDASYTRSDVVGNFGAFTSTGAGHTMGVSGTWYLTPDAGRRSYLTLGLEDKLFEATVINDVPIGAHRRSRPVTVGYAARTDTDTASWGYNLDLAVNAGGGSFNDLASYQTEDPRITTTRWQALRGGANYAAPFAGSWTWLARVKFQYSGDVLISGEQFGLGGVGFVRGTRTDRPITGDKGVAASLEVATPELRPALRLVGFADAGWLGNNSPNGANKPPADRLASVGVGVRYGGERFGGSLDYGRIVEGSRVPLALNSASPRRGDDRAYVNFSWRF